MVLIQIAATCRACLLSADWPGRKFRPNGLPGNTKFQLLFSALDSFLGAMLHFEKIRSLSDKSKNSLEPFKLGWPLVLANPLFRTVFVAGSTTAGSRAEPRACRTPPSTGSTWPRPRVAQRPDLGRAIQLPVWLWVKTNGIPFWGRCTTHFSLF